MSRIVSGAARGRRLQVPTGRGTRPTADRTREALFSAIEAQIGSLAGLRFLDLYAGSGAVGLEALSRGAELVVLVESDRRAAAVITANIAAVGLPGALLRTEPVAEAVRTGLTGRFDVAFLDPPYELADAEVVAVLEALHAADRLTTDALVVVERPTRGAALDWPPDFERVRERRYGEATLWYGRAAGAERE